MKLDYIKPGVRGKFSNKDITFHEGKGAVVNGQRSFPFTVKEVRGVDFTIVKDGGNPKAPCHCEWPKNTKDGLETVTLHHDGKGYTKVILHDWQDSVGKHLNVISIDFTFEV